MKKPPWVGLICAGPVSRSGLARLPKLHEHLGWVKSNTIAAASRAVNALNAGRAVRDYESLSKAQLIIIQSADERLDAIVDALCASGLHWQGKTVAAYHATLDGSALHSLERLGATVGSIALVGENPLRFLIEGHPDSLRRMRRLFRAAGVSAVEIGEGHKAAYLAGVYAATAEFLPLMAKAIDWFQRAGIDKATASATAASLVQSTMRAYFRVGNRLLRGPASDGELNLRRGHARDGSA